MRGVETSFDMYLTYGLDTNFLELQTLMMVLLRCWNSHLFANENFLKRLSGNKSFIQMMEILIRFCLLFFRCNSDECFCT